jgi:hypothetical protein
MSPSIGRLSGQRGSWILPSSSSGKEGTAPLSLYLYHQHSKLFFDAVLPFEAEDGTGQCTEPLVMTLPAPHVQSSLIIRRCPRQKRLGGLVHVPAREDAFSKPCVFSLTETFHAYVVGNPEEDDQLKQWNSHITPPTE